MNRRRLFTSVRQRNAIIHRLSFSVRTRPWEAAALLTVNTETEKRRLLVLNRRRVRGLTCSLYRDSPCVTCAYVTPQPSCQAPRISDKPPRAWARASAALSTATRAVRCDRVGGQPRAVRHPPKTSKSRVNLPSVRPPHDTLCFFAQDFMDKRLRFSEATYSAGGFRSWWRRSHGGSDDQLDNAHLIRMAGRFSRRVPSWARTNGVPGIDCDHDERKHEIAAAHLKKNPNVRGVFLVLVGRAVATLWEVKRSRQGVIQNLQTKRPMYSNTVILASAWVLNRCRANSSHSKLAKKLSGMSKQSPTEPIDGWTPWITGVPACACPQEVRFALRDQQPRQLRARGAMSSCGSVVRSKRRRHRKEEAKYMSTSANPASRDDTR